MREDIEQRAINTATHMLNYKCTIRQAAEQLNMSRATVHVDVSKRLPKVNPALHDKIKKLLVMNYLHGCSRGGKAAAGKPRKRRNKTKNKNMTKLWE